MSEGDGSECPSALLSVRLVVVDHYQSDPVAGLDPLVSQFTGYNIKKVPVIRIFGSSPAGQRTCLHLHGVFPYFYVPMPDDETDGFVYRLAGSLNKALNLSLNQPRAKIEHVYKAVKVSGIPMYGYHAKKHTYIKIFFYNPYMVKRASDLLMNGAVMNKILQPHESHVNMVLQFMMDYNLQGMNDIHLACGRFRQGQFRDELDEVESIMSPPWFSGRPPRAESADLSSEDPSIVIPAMLEIPATQRYFNVEDLPDFLKMPPDVARQATTELELDAVTADILNKLDLTGEAMNPGLVALWTDERLRREAEGLTDPLTPPSSPPRDARAEERSESERFWHERLCRTIQEMKLTSGPRECEDPEDPDATINLDKKLRPEVYAAETAEKELDSLPDTTQLSMSESLLNCTSDLTLDTSLQFYSDQTIVDEDLILSQLERSENEPERFDESVDEELVDLLAGLADGSDNEEEVEEGNIMKTPQSIRSQPQIQGSSKKRSISGSKQDQEEEEDPESLEMSQAVWNSDWAEKNQTLLENLTRSFSEQTETDDCDIEDLFKS